MSWSTQILTFKSIVIKMKARSMNSRPIWPAQWVWGCVHAPHPTPSPEACPRPNTRCTKVQKKKEQTGGAVLDSALVPDTYEVEEILQKDVRRGKVWYCALEGMAQRWGLLEARYQFVGV